MTGLLQNKVAIVTGGGSGIGEAVARRFAAEGCTVVVTGRRRQPLDRVAAAIGGLAVVADVSDEADVAKLFKVADEAYGRLDILVNNAGYGGGGVRGAAEIDAAEWDKTFAINVRGVMLCIKHAIPRLKRHGGAIVNVASNVGIRPNPRQIAYAASKAAVVNLTKSVADEVGVLGIRVNSVCPGAVDTDLFRGNAARRAAASGGTVDDDIKRIANACALKRLTTRDEVASAVLFLATEGSGSMTGNSIVMDAGKV